MTVERQQKLFQALHDSEVGKLLTEYLEKVVNDVYDVRQWDTDTTRESAEYAAKMIQSRIIDKVALQTIPKKLEVNPYM